MSKSHAVRIPRRIRAWHTFGYVVSAGGLAGTILEKLNQAKIAGARGEHWPSCSFALSFRACLLLRQASELISERVEE